LSFRTKLFNGAANLINYEIDRGPVRDETGT
jgi:hypothetical protein